MEGIISRDNDENAPTFLPAKKGLATAAAALAVGNNNTRKRAALQTLTNISRQQPRQLDGKQIAKVSVYSENNDGRGIKRKVIGANNENNTVAVRANSVDSLRADNVLSYSRASSQPKDIEETYLNSDDTVEEDDEDDEDENEEDEEGQFYQQRRLHHHGDVMEDIDSIEELDIKKNNNHVKIVELPNIEEDDDDEEENIKSARRDEDYDDVDVDDEYEENINDNILLHDLTEPTALAVMNIINDSVLNPNALFPIWEQADKEELRQAYYEIRNSPGILDEDDEDTYDISMVVEYGDDIFAYMRQLEVKMRPSPGYMDLQTEIQWSMRSVLVDWLVQVHHRFNLLPETLFLTINYMDRFLSIKVVSLSKFQLVGIVALFLAAKYEEINCPSVQEIVYMVENGFSADEILKAERYMIDLLDFNLGWPGPMSFLRRTSKADDYDLETRTLAKYLLEISIMDERFVGALPSWIAAAAHYLSRHMLNRGEWTSAHVYFSGYTAPQLTPAVEVLMECCEKPLEHHKAIYEKYSDRKFKRASLFVADYMQNKRTSLPKRESKEIPKTATTSSTTN